MLYTQLIQTEITWYTHKLVSIYGYRQVYSKKDLEIKTFLIEKRGNFHYVTYNSPDNHPLIFDDVVDIKRLEW
jgi:hypothetical protein